MFVILLPCTVCHKSNKTVPMACALKIVLPINTIINMLMLLVLAADTVGIRVCKQQELSITSVRNSAVAAACFHSHMQMFRMSLAANERK